MVNSVILGFPPGHTVLITGAGTGIGRSTAECASAVGLRVVVWDVDEKAARQTTDHITGAGGEAVCVARDASVAAEIAAGFDAVERFGPVNYLVNNAAPPAGASLSFDSALLESVSGVQRMTEQWLSRSGPSAQAVVNVSSVAGNYFGARPDWYPTSKAAMTGYTRHLASCRAGAIRANCVAPGMTKTPRLVAFSDSELGRQIVSRIPQRRMGEPAEIAWTILFLLSPLASYVNGAIVAVDGGWTVAE